jgi:quinol monooxygenase YgiN
MRAGPGKREELRAAVESLIHPTSQEAGHVNYDLHQGVKNPDASFPYENWESGEHLDDHLQAPHLAELAARIPDLLDEGGLTVNRVRPIA